MGAKQNNPAGLRDVYPLLPGGGRGHREEALAGLPPSWLGAAVV